MNRTSPAHLVCIIQARRTSTRLPDKTMKPLSGEPVLAHVIKRCQAIPSVSEVIVAGIDDPYEDPLFGVAQATGATIFKGSKEDVLSRYYFAAQKAKADWVMRVTSDCPFFDPEVAEDLVQLTVQGAYDYGGNGGWPHGLDCEVFTFKLLEKAHSLASSKPDREHVTLWMKRQNTIKKAALARPPLPAEKIAKYRWVVDYPEDYEFLKAVHAALGTNATTARWKDIADLLDAHPELLRINQEAKRLWAAETAKIMENSAQQS